MGDLSAPARVLLIEDDESTSAAIIHHLRRAGIAVDLATDGLAGLAALRREPPDLLLLDLMLPGVDGWYLIREVRSWAPGMPIIVVTGRTNEPDRVAVLALGADDVVAKPFSMRELTARVRAALRTRAAAADAEAGAAVTFGDLVLDAAEGIVSLDGVVVTLTVLERRLLALLAEHPERALSREEIHRRLWGGERRHGDRGVDALVSRLRRKLEPPDGRYRYLHTRRGVGYCLEAVLRA